MSVTTAEKPPRKFPPPCWTQDEALALIEAYKERWYALRRGYLRTSDWDAVAASVGRSYPDASPAKTSAQCRHKMEKLRQRYRAEKQRALSYPGRFLSSWFFFESMDAMDSGETRGNSSGLDHGPVDQNSAPSRFRSKVSINNGKPLVPIAHSAAYMDYGSDEDEDDGSGYGFQAKTQIDPNSVPQSFRAKKFGKHYGDDDELGGGGSGYHSKIPIDLESGFRPKKFNKTEGKMNPNFSWNDDAYNGMDANGDYWVKVPSEMNSGPMGGYRGKSNSSSAKMDRSSNPNLDPRVSNGFSVGARGKRERGPVAEMVASIRVLGEGFMKMEKMKMEMAKDIEKMRIEMEMKRNAMFLESQHQIVDSFVKGLLEKKKKKKVKVKETESVES